MTQDDIAAFDSLPAPVRAALREARCAISTGAIDRLCARGLSDDDIVKLVLEVDRRMVNDREWELAFFGV